MVVDVDAPLTRIPSGLQGACEEFDARRVRPGVACVIRYFQVLRKDSYALGFVWHAPSRRFRLLPVYRLCAVQHAGARIEKGDARWAEYVKAHQINEVAPLHRTAEIREGHPRDHQSRGKDTDGLYFYRRNEEACMRR